MILSACPFSPFYIPVKVEIAEIALKNMICHLYASLMALTMDMNGAHFGNGEM